MSISEMIRQGNLKGAIQQQLEMDLGKTNKNIPIAVENLLHVFDLYQQRQNQKDEKSNAD